METLGFKLTNTNRICKYINIKFGISFAQGSDKDLNLKRILHICKEKILFK